MHKSLAALMQSAAVPLNKKLWHLHRKFSFVCASVWFSARSGELAMPGCGARAGDRRLKRCVEGSSVKSATPRPAAIRSKIYLLAEAATGLKEE